MNKTISLTQNKRLFSLDFFRGFTMFVLIGEATGLFPILVSPELKGTIVYSIGTQFHHHPWHGLRAWDLVEPFFMFIVGVALPFSVFHRMERGDSMKAITRHALRRSLTLFILGIVIYSVYAGKPVWELWNVLTQLAFTYLFAFLIMRKKLRTQLIISFGLLLLTDLLYRFWPVPGFDQPFVPDHNFGSWMDLFLMGKLESDHWVAINVLPTTAFTVWGVIAGIVLRSNRSDMQKVKTLLIAGIIGVVAGYSLDPVIPIIKKICTVSFMLVGGGWSLVALAFSYWLVDIKNVRKVPAFFAVVGMNPLFIYLFTNFGGGNFLHHIIRPFAVGLFGWTGDKGLGVVSALIVWFLFWYLCYWLYEHKLFIKI